MATTISRLIIAGLGLALVFSISCTGVRAQTPAPIMIIAPHPDDEALMFSGVIYRQLQAGGRVKVVVLTNGDLQGQAIGLQREGETVAAMTKLGMDPQDIIFLGYPDAVMENFLSASSATQIIPSFDGLRKATYANAGFGKKDWHSMLFGAPGSYNLVTVQEDMRSVIEAYRPSDIYTTSESDSHPDHVTCYVLAHDALAQIEQEIQNYQPKFHKTVIHDERGPDAWPNPSASAGPSNRYDPTKPFDLPLNVEEPGLANLPLERVAVPTIMLDKTTNNLKFQVINLYQTQASPFLNSFVKTDEIFWLDPPIPPTTGGGSGGGVSTNVALNATATASSQNTNTSQTANKAIDGVISGYPNDFTKEWATVGGGTGSWLKLTWSTPQQVNKVILYDRPNTSDWITGGTITFSDGSTVQVGSLNNNGTATEVDFAAKTITTLTFTVTSFSGSNAGLSEIQVFNVAPTGGGASNNNLAPITSLGVVANPAAIKQGATTTLTTDAVSPSGSPLTYIWAPSSGAVAGNGSNVIFTPDSIGNIRVQSVVIDGAGRTIASEAVITVSLGTVLNPVIAAEPVSSPAFVAANGATTVTVSATDPNGFPLTYEWSSTSGTITGSGPSVQYIAPNATTDQVVTVNVLVSNGHGGLSSDFVAILVTAANHAPVLTGPITAVATRIASLTTTTLGINAFDPDGNPLTYQWLTTAGQIAGTGNTAKFTAPKVASSRAVIITVVVTDGKGGEARGYLVLTVTATPPATNTLKSPNPISLTRKH